MIERGKKGYAVAAFPTLVSVVVPTRDRPAPLERAVAAVLGQDYPGEIECVVVFDQLPLHRPEGLTGPPRRSLRAVGNHRKPRAWPAPGTRGSPSARGQLVAHDKLPIGSRTRMDETSERRAGQ